MNLIIKDPTFIPKANYSRFEKVFLALIRDERDLPFIWLCMRILTFSVPVAVYLFIDFRWWIAVPYLLMNTVILLGPLILMLHNTSHRTLFKKKYHWMNQIIPWFIAPFFGQTPETYYSHHIMMHHPENNAISDLSCTMNFQRDRFSDFLKYFTSFFFVGIVDLSYYFWRKKRWHFLRKVLLGELSYFLLCAFLWRFNSSATFVVFVLPFVIARLAMMSGNWAQHAFIDAEAPDNCFRNSITCINSRYNRICFNDGYHIGHHLRPSIHWTEMPVEFQKNIEKYKENNAVIFQGLDFFAIWYFLMIKDYQKLAQHYVDIRGQFQSQDAIMAFLRSRVAKLDVKRSTLNANVVLNRVS
ncbi:fatty acid desaturase family protein [Oligoflexus tunisiensis]|uniref:fatty acid desaturase family protein n=1 Tax=Oligoflexus tunisiensis TaxID=708132 RepID=UPI000A732E2A|nr:fatty acid desaturase [Oligoflexus tunisiensis]